MTNKHETTDYSVGIVGGGFVGQAMKYLFPLAKLYDINPKVSKNSKKEVNRCEIVFVAVPTDAKEDGSVNLSAVDDALSWLDGPTIVIKSTIPPKNADIYSQRGAVVCPEFLTEKNWKSDVDNETRIIIGGKAEPARKVLKLFQKVCGAELSYFLTDAYTAMFVKYVANSYFATKVAFFNQIYDACKESNIEYDEVRLLLLQDKRIGNSHTLISEQRGYGGYCLPKDTKGFLKDFDELTILKEVDRYNDFIRFLAQE